MKLIVDWDLCDGNGLCEAEAPELLHLDEDDQLIILRESFGEELRDRALRAVQACPKCALYLDEGDD